jgi:cytochrome c peroxidase
MKTIAWVALLWSGSVAIAADGALDHELALVLQAARFSGSAGLQLESRLGRPIDRTLADLGRLLFFDKILNLHSDNSCAGCHAPEAGFGDTQSIAIGVQNNNVVGPHRSGPRNQRRTPMLINDAFFPKLMWNGRFFVPSGDPFDNAQGFLFPPPEGTTRFPPHDPVIRHLLAAQGQLPPTELTEAAGFTGTRRTLGAQFDPFDDGLGTAVPPPDASGSRNEPIRQVVLRRLNDSAPYRSLFARSFPSVARGQPIDFSMVGLALAEFQFTLVFANAPIDRLARGERGAMTDGQKRGALLFFGEARCVTCHAVSGNSNEMFSDFTNRRIGVPQLAPEFGVGKGNVIFDGPRQNEDYGAEQISNRPEDRYKFRTSPLRNVALQPAFFHDGAFTQLEHAIAHHLNPAVSARLYSPALAGVARDLIRPTSPVLPLLLDLDPLLANSRPLTLRQFWDLVEFVRDGLLDARAKSEHLCRLIPDSLPSGMSPPLFEGCPERGRNALDAALPDVMNH